MSEATCLLAGLFALLTLFYAIGFVIVSKTLKDIEKKWGIEKKRGKR